MSRQAVNPPAFEEAVYKHLAGKENQFNYAQMVETFLDFQRFVKWTALIGRQTNIEGTRVLSSGCGFGGSLLSWWQAGAAEVQGVEVDPEFVEMAQIRVEPYEGLTVHPIGPRDSLSFPDAYFDIIESMDVIEHVEDVHEYMAELVRVLKPGGRILMVTPNRIWPVEQHLNIAGPPWMPVAVADELFGLASKLPFLDEDRRFKYSKLKGMRTQNMSLLRVRGLAKRYGLHMELIHDEPDNPNFPLPPQPAWHNKWLYHPIGKFFSPIKAISVILHKP